MCFCKKNDISCSSWDTTRIYVANHKCPFFDIQQKVLYNLTETKYLENNFFIPLKDKKRGIYFYFWKYFFLPPQSQNKSSKTYQNYFSRDLLLFFDFFQNEKKGKKRPKNYFSRDLLLFFDFFLNEKKKQKKTKIVFLKRFTVVF